MDACWFGPSKNSTARFAFRDGHLVGGRSSIAGEIDATGTATEDRTARAEGVLRSLGGALAEGVTHSSFIEDPDIADSEVDAWFPARNALEAALHGFVPSTELWASAELFGTTQPTQDLDALPLDRIDQQIVHQFDGLLVNRDSISRVADSLACSSADVLIRLHTLVALGALKGQTASAPMLRKTAQRLASLNYFDVLEVSTNATSEAVADAFSERCEALGATEKGDDDQAVRLARRDIQAVLEKARDILSDTHMKAAYQRSQQLSLDFDDDAVRARLLKEHLLSFAQKKLDASQFEDAQDALSRVVRDHPDDEDVHIKLGWAAFLNSDRSPTQADEAATHINRRSL